MTTCRYMYMYRMDSLEQIPQPHQPIMELLTKKQHWIIFKYNS